MSQIAKGLQTAGQAAGQSTEGQYLQQLASNFASVASTGDILQLLPQTSTQGYNSSGQSVPSSLGIDPTSSIIPQLLAGMTPSAGQ